LTLNDSLVIVYHLGILTLSSSPLEGGQENAIGRKISMEILVHELMERNIQIPNAITNSSYVQLMRRCFVFLDQHIPKVHSTRAKKD